MARRPFVSDTIVDLVKLDLEIELRRRIGEKGPGAFMSSHEIKGVIGEEYDELKATVHGNNHEEMYKELLDMMVACLWSAASLKGEYIDW